jgi:hypothetical protein
VEKEKERCETGRWAARGVGSSGRGREERKGGWPVGRLRVGQTGRLRRERTLTGGPLGLNKFDLFQTNSTHSNLIWSKQDLPLLQKFEIKYGFEWLNEGNNFPYRNFSRFEMESESKFRGTSMSWISIEINWKFLEI